MIHAIIADMGGDAPAFAGQRYDMAPGLAILVDGEKEVLVKITEGFTNKDIADRLGLGVRAVEARRKSLMRKLGIHGAARLTHFAISQGLIVLDACAELTPCSQRSE